MQGLRIREHCRLPGRGWVRPPVPKGVSDFAFFFEPILAHLACYWWMFCDWPTSYPPNPTDDDIDIYEDDVSEQLGPWVRKRYVPPGVLLPKYARFIRDDWNSLFGTLGKPNPDRFLSELETVGDGHRILEEHVAIVFRNTDGVSWEIYARETELLTAVASHVRRLDIPLLEDIGLTESWRPV